VVLPFGKEKLNQDERSLGSICCQVLASLRGRRLLSIPASFALKNEISTYNINAVILSRKRTDKNV
jgi:hypothetical protein